MLDEAAAAAVHLHMCRQQMDRDQHAVPARTKTVMVMDRHREAQLLE
jgi:hypothetical protein